MRHGSNTLHWLKSIDIVIELACSKSLMLVLREFKITQVTLGSQMFLFSSPFLGCCRFYIQLPPERFRP